jgi:hypothetical protein
MAFQQDYLTVDNNLGTVAITILPGAMQVDLALRMNRGDFFKGKPAHGCLNLEDRYILDVVQTIGQTVQQGLGYEAANFIDIASIRMI